MRTDDEILNVYYTNRDITRDECRRLYDLIDDPWDLGSELNYRCYSDIVRTLDKYIQWYDIDWIVDYGSGIGTFTQAF